MSLSISRRREMLLHAEQEITAVLRVLAESEARVRSAIEMLHEVLADPDTTADQAAQARRGLATAAETLDQLAAFRLEVVDTRGFIAATDARLDTDFGHP
jgi:uncharacterized membrane protein